jgi:LmbE family N-acetylglucosaminyl deacetylase
MKAIGRVIGRAAALGVLALGMVTPRSAVAQERGAAALGQLIAGLGVSARVLMVGAHPDDEDTQLVAWLARGRHVETAYLSLTRGDGGQNLIGNELGEGLGVIRTEELLAARRIDGAHQFFTRAYDFGFSKSADETYRHWPRDSILRDVVTVVRGFKPHVIVAVFSGTPRDGHGHHQVAGMLARDAFELAGDTVRFPSRMTAGLPAWTATHFYRGQRGNATGATYGVNVGEYSPLLGRSYAEIAGDSRSQHKSQGFGVLQRKGVQMDYVRREASRLRTPAGGETPLFEGVDTTFARFNGALAPAGRAVLDSARAAMAEARRAYNAFDPSTVVAPLAAVVRHLDAICPPESVLCGAPPTSAAASVAWDLALSVDMTRANASAALALAAGIAIEANASRELWPVGAAVPVDVRVYNRGEVPIEVPAVAYGFPEAGRAIAFETQKLMRADDTPTPPDSVARVSVQVPAPVVTSPWWLATPRAGDIFSTRINGLPEQSHSRTGLVRVHLRIAGAAMHVDAPIVYRYADAVQGEVERPVSIVPAAAVTLDRAVEVAPQGAAYERAVQVRVVSALSDTQPVRVGLRLPTGLTADSAARTVTLSPGAATTLTFRVRGRPAAGTHEIGAEATVAATASRTGFDLIEYPHIRPQRMYRPASIALRVADVSVPMGLRITYVPGVSDNVAPVLQQLGFTLGVIQPTALDTFDLSATDVVVVGPRAYEAHPALVRNNARLLAWVQRGGTMVVQYGQYEMQAPGIMPFPVTLQRPQDRVTEEDAPVRVLDPGAPVLSTPNRITQADFAGWVQERALYMPRTFAEAYTPMLSMNDPGEPPNSGGILVAPYGSGTYVYTTLSFFRQLPAGVPGATRLFVNLLAAGQKGRPAVP